MNRVDTFEVIPSKQWINSETGQTASIYGAVPYLSESEKAQWSVAVRGYTVRNLKTGAVGIGRMPWKTEEEALAWIKS
jgi:hypothetical protein